MNDKEPYAFLGEGVVTVGLGELPELVRQSEEYAAAWTARGHRGRYLPVPAHDQFSILDELARPKGAILEALQEMASGDRAATRPTCA